MQTSSWPPVVRTSCSSACGWFEKEDWTIATFVISDIHGEYDKFIRLLEKIQLKNTDTLYILGDVLDRGEHPVRVLLKLMEMPNAVLIAGNHEVMALRCLDFLKKEITEESVAEINDELMENLLLWEYNGAQTTIDEFRMLDRELQEDVIDYLKDAILYVELEAGGREYILVHAGLGHFFPGKKLYDYTIDDLVWKRPNYNRRYFKDRFVVTGHTPTQNIRTNPNPGYIFRNKNHIAIDCGACYSQGRLAAICLDTDEEYYV